MSNNVLCSTLSESLTKAHLACQKCAQPYNQVKPSKLDCIHNLCIACLTDFRCSLCTNQDRKIAVGDLSKSLRVMEITSQWKIRFSSGGQNAVKGSDDISKKVEPQQSSCSSTPVARTPQVSPEQQLLQDECRKFFDEKIFDISYQMNWDRAMQEKINNDFKQSPHQWIFFRKVADNKILGFAQITGAPGAYNVLLGAIEREFLFEPTVTLVSYLKDKSHIRLKPEEASYEFRFTRPFALIKDIFKERIQSTGVKFEVDASNDELVKVYPLIRASNRYAQSLCYKILAPFESNTVSNN